MLQSCADLPFSFAFSGSEGDLEWHAVAYKMVQYYRCSLLCPRCYASQTMPELLYTDASDVAIGAVLEQRGPKGWEPLAFFSKKLSEADFRKISAASSS